MITPRRSARIAAKVAKATPVVVPVATKAAAVVPAVPDMSDVQKINAMMIHCNTVIGQVEKIKANTEMFDMLREVRLWEHNDLFRRSVEQKLAEYLEKEIPTCLNNAIEMYDRPLEWAIYDLKDAVENLKEMMNGSPVSMVRVKLQKFQRKLTAELDELGNDLDYCHPRYESAYRAAYDAKAQELKMVEQRLKNLR